MRDAEIALDGQSSADERATLRLYLKLLDEHGMAVFRYAYGVVGDRMLAEDIMQDTFLAAYENMASLRNTERASPWLFQIATNNIRQHLRRDRLRRLVPIHLADPQQDNATSVEDRVDATLLTQYALSRLGRSDREILLLVGLLGFSQREVAEILGTRQSAAHKRWQRARDRFLKFTARRQE